MGLEITIKVDGQTEQQVAPIIRQIMTRHPELLSGESNQANLPERAFYPENSALLQQQIQQLVAQNRLLERQVTDSQRLLEGMPPVPALPAARIQPSAQPEECWPSGLPKQAVSAPVAPVADSRPDPTSRTPALPARYQPSRTAVALYLLKRSTAATGQRLWQILTWLSFGKEWLAIFFLLSGGIYATRMVFPEVVGRFQDHPEFVDSAGSSPGAATPESTSEASDRPGDKPTEGSADEPPTTQPAPPASKAGSNPAPPAAFQ